MMFLLRFAVYFLLIMGTNRLTGHNQSWKRAMVAAAVCGLHMLLCMHRRMFFLQNWYWRLVLLGLMGWIAFGGGMAAFRRSVVFFLLSMALEGLTACLGSGGMRPVLLSAGVLCVLCVVAFQQQIGTAAYVPVEICYRGKRVRLTAMCDSGNTLRDPLTGRPVLVVDPEAARYLTGLTDSELCKPVETMAAGVLPGLRLIPYRSVGCANGMLLALRMQEVRIGRWKGSSVVAFAPEMLCSEGGYQALTGGIVC